jgi:hypothetical protein
MSVEMETREILDADGNHIGDLSMPEDTSEYAWAIALSSYVISLDDRKAAKIKEIDKRTQELIESGFSFDGHSFSLSLSAQVNWIGLKVMSELLTWPIEITTVDDGAYELQQVNLLAFAATAAATVQSHLAAGRALKLQVQAAASKEAVEAIKDNR